MWDAWHAPVGQPSEEFLEVPCLIVRVFSCILHATSGGLLECSIYYIVYAHPPVAATLVFLRSFCWECLLVVANKCRWKMFLLGVLWVMVYARKCMEEG